MINLHSKMKAGKAMISLPGDSIPVEPAIIMSTEADTVACVTSDGYLLAFPLSDLPALSKGKGNKLINIPPKRLKAGEEYMLGMVVVAEKEEILVWAGQRYLRIGKKDLEHFRGERAKRGHKLPRGFQRVTKIEVARD
jgi:topoisomerase-4 subunit A